MDDGLGFCVWCGARLADASSALETAETVATEKPAAAPPLDRESPERKPDDESRAEGGPEVLDDEHPHQPTEAVSGHQSATSAGPRRRPYLLVILAVLVVALGTTLWLSLRPGESGADETAQASTEGAEESPSDAREGASAPGATAEEGAHQDGNSAADRGHESHPPGRRKRTTARATGPTPVAESHPRASRSGLITKRVDVSRLPRWPAPAAIVYAGKNFRGRSQTFGVGAVPHLRGTRLGDNAATSLDLVGGARLTLYLKPAYKGRQETFVQKVQSLKHSKIRNNRASSLRVEPPDVGRILWKSGPVYSLGLTFEIERGRNGLVVLFGQGRTATYVSPSLVPRAGPGLEKLLQGSSALRRSLGSPVTHGVRLENGKLAVQLFQHGVLAYAPGSERGWYQLDPR